MNRLSNSKISAPLGATLAPRNCEARAAGIAFETLIN